MPAHQETKEEEALRDMCGNAGLATMLRLTRLTETRCASTTASYAIYEAEEKRYYVLQGVIHGFGHYGIICASKNHMDGDGTIDELEFYSYPPGVSLDVDDFLAWADGLPEEIDGRVSGLLNVAVLLYACFDITQALLASGEVEHIDEMRLMQRLLENTLEKLFGGAHPMREADEKADEKDDEKQSGDTR